MSPEEIREVIPLLERAGMKEKAGWARDYLKKKYGDLDEMQTLSISASR